MAVAEVSELVVLRAGYHRGTVRFIMFWPGYKQRCLAISRITFKALLFPATSTIMKSFRGKISIATLHYT